MKNPFTRLFKQHEPEPAPEPVVETVDEEQAFWDDLNVNIEGNTVDGFSVILLDGKKYLQGSGTPKYMIKSVAKAEQIGRALLETERKRRQTTVTKKIR